LTTSESLGTFTNKQASKQTNIFSAKLLSIIIKFLGNVQRICTIVAQSKCKRVIDIITRFPIAGTHPGMGQLHSETSLLIQRFGRTNFVGRFFTPICATTLIPPHPYTSALYLHTLPPSTHTYPHLHQCSSHNLYSGSMVGGALAILCSSLALRMALSYASCACSNRPCDS